MSSSQSKYKLPCQYRLRTNKSIQWTSSNQYLDHNLGNNPNEQITPTTEVSDKIQNRTKLLIDKTKQNIMQSYIKYKKYYNRKAEAAPLTESDGCFVLQPKADYQGSKISFRDYHWVGPFIVQKVLPKSNIASHSPQKVCS